MVFLLSLILFLGAKAQAIDCKVPEDQNIESWMKLISQDFDQKLKDAKLTGLNQDIYRNQLVTLGYYEISKKHPMGYIYTNASHHLGRLVRYQFWKEHPENELGQKDVELISGDVLGTTIELFPRSLSQKLMLHSVNLYKTLSWSLVARNECGRDYVLDLLSKIDCSKKECHYFPKLPSEKYPHVLDLLRKAHLKKDIIPFALAFVAFEQTYLQYTMYAEVDIMLATAAGVLDKMRFIPFNGQRHLSFFDWCEENHCGKTSLDLQDRIYFDQKVIEEELRTTHLDPKILKSRLLNSHILDVSDFILKELHQ